MHGMVLAPTGKGNLFSLTLVSFLTFKHLSLCSLFSNIFKIQTFTSSQKVLRFLSFLFHTTLACMRASVLRTRTIPTILFYFFFSRICCIRIASCVISFSFRSHDTDCRFGFHSHSRTWTDGWILVSNLPLPMKDGMGDWWIWSYPISFGRLENILDYICPLSFFPPAVMG